MNPTADIVIIGAGSTGTSIAYHLAKKGMKRIMVLEKIGVGSGATGYAAGLIRHHYPDRQLVRMARYGSLKLEHFREEMGFDIDHVKNGFCYLTPEGAEIQADMIAMQRSEGVNIEVLSPEDIETLHPIGPVNTQGIGFGLMDYDAAYCDPYKVATGYLENARKLGVDVKIGAAVKDLIVKNGKVAEVVTDKGRIFTEFVVNAAGTGAVAVNKMLGIDLPLKAMSLQHGVLVPNLEFDPDVLTISDASTDGFLFFLRPENGGTVLIGMDQEDQDRGFSIDSYYMDIGFDKLRNFYEYLITRLPFAKKFRLQIAFGALDLRTPDWNPGVGSLDEGPEGYFLAVGGSGHCFKLAPAIGKGVAESIVGESASFDLSIFDVNRLKNFSNKNFSGRFFVEEAGY